jgi:oxygen-independent coproporphyrinogen-3 oxidase
VAAARPAPGDNGRVPSAPPPGDPAPPTGELPAAALAGLGERPFGFYVHVPFCVTRCGYCDFNTYTDLGGMQSSYAAVVVREIELARRVLGDADVPVSTVFVGGGTPTLLPAGDLARSSARSSAASAWRPARRSPPRPTRRRSTPATSASCARRASPG